MLLLLIAQATNQDPGHEADGSGTASTWLLHPSRRAPRRCRPSIQLVTVSKEGLDIRLGVEHVAATLDDGPWSWRFVSTDTHEVDGLAVFLLGLPRGCQEQATIPNELVVRVIGGMENKLLTPLQGEFLPQSGRPFGYDHV